jgi:flagellar basal-body rod protein FlgB
LPPPNRRPISATRQKPAAALSPHAQHFQRLGCGLRVAYTTGGPKEIQVLDAKTQLLGKYMDLLALQQRVTATNIANADTPGYRTRRVDCLWEYQQAIQQRDDKPATPLWIPAHGGFEVKNDGNDVSLDRELRLMAETGIRYSLAAQFARGHLRSIRSAIQEGRGG